MSRVTELASAQINHDQLSVELVAPSGMPAMTRGQSQAMVKIA
jgi:hypothetical protein